MKIVLPLSSSDARLLDKWVEVVSHLGGCASDSLTIVPTRSVESKASSFVEKLMTVFGEVKVESLDHDPGGGWPQAPNFHFYMAAIKMSRTPGPWMWCEVDCLPIKPNWTSSIGARYASLSVPYFGCIVKTPFRDDSTHAIVDSPQGPEDKMMCGCSIYPQDMCNRPEMKGLLEDFAKGPDAPSREGFDMYIRAAIINRRIGHAHSELIANHWNTENYRYENGRIQCDAGKTHPSTPKDWEIRRFPGPVHPDAVCIHGCKDDSLANLVLLGEIPMELPRVVDMPRQAPNEEVLELKNRFNRLEELLLRSLEAKQAPAQSTEVPPEPKPKNDPITDTILATIASGPKRLKDVSEATGLSQAEIRAAASQNGCKFKIAGPAGWVKAA